MARLLAMYQKMRLIREKNQLVLKQTKVSSKKSRITKNIERVQKRYTSLFSQLDSQAKMFQNNAKLAFQNMFNLGGNSVNPYSYTGMNGFVYNILSSAMKQGGYKASQDSDPLPGLTDQEFSNMYSEYIQNGGFIKKKDESGNVIQDEYANYSKEQVAAFNYALQMGQTQQQQAQWQCNQMSQQYDNNISIWLENQKAQLEEEQDEALEPLNMEDTMLDLEKEQIDARLTQINAEIESYTQLASQEAKQSAPTFGLA